ncbi:acetyl-CoA carboxylase biotin carboxyl carrier protein [Elusimicrobiota bacterium]
MAHSKSDLLDSTLKKNVSNLYELMQDEKLEEIEIQEKDLYVHLKRKGRASANVSPSPATISKAAAQSSEPAKSAGSAVAGETIKSPIMGVFYRSPSPSSPAFADEGDVVNPGKTLCIVEAMKLMNEIKADSKMKIAKILVENGQPVTADQDLFIIEKI